MGGDAALRHGWPGNKVCGTGEVGWRTGELARLAVRLPGRMDRFLAQAERGELVVQYSLAPNAAKERAASNARWIA